MRVGTELYYNARYREKLQHETDRTGLVYSRPGQAGISLVTVEREVRVYSLVVSDPMLRCTVNAGLGK